MAEKTHFRGIMDRFGWKIGTLGGIKIKINGMNRD